LQIIIIVNKKISIIQYNIDNFALSQKIYLNNNNNKNNIIIIIIEVDLKKENKFGKSILVIIYYKKLKIFVIEAKRLINIAQIKKNYYSKIYKIYINN